MKVVGRQWSEVGLILTVVLFVLCFRVEAQQPAKVHRIAFLTGASRSAVSSRTDAFRDRLYELGYVQGKNITIEYRYAEGKSERTPLLAAELVRSNVDVIVTGGSPATRAAKNVTSTIPIIMALDDDPVANGFIESLARPGGNITGLSTLAPEIIGKQLEVLKEIIPRLSHVAVIGTSNRPGTAQTVKEVERAAGSLGIQPRFLDVVAIQNIETAFREAIRERSDAILVLGSPVLNSERKQIVELAVKHRLPAAYSRSEYVQEGGLMTYSVSITELFRRAAIYVDKVLKGAKPADLPVEQPTKFELVINLKAAKQIGLTIPPNVLARADKVIR
jgi:putative tryptophan/tyrosine transport system substrate-binding protein